MPLYKGLDRIPDLLIPGLYTKNKTLYFIWRAVCHTLASLVVLLISHQALLGTGYDIPLYVFIVLVAFVLYKELYADPKNYHQRPLKGITDILSWVLPFVVYFILR